MITDRTFTIRTFLLVPLGIAVNLLGAQLALHFELPLFLDSIGTILAAALGSYLPGMLVGLFSNYINSLADSVTLYYGVISVIFALIAAWLSQRGVFCKLTSALSSSLLFALIGGGVGSLLTWALFGLGFGSGISAPYAIVLHQQAGLSQFAAQLTADLGIDLADKLLTLALVFVALRYLPRTWLAGLPLSRVYLDGDHDLPAPYAIDRAGGAAGAAGDDGSQRRRLWESHTYRQFSLSNKVALLVTSTAIIVSLIAISISYVVYEDTMNQRYVELGQSTVNIVQRSMNADAINGYLEQGVRTPDYVEAEQRLYQLKESMPMIHFIYVYQIREDGCHVVFDLDTPEVPAGELGEVIPFDASFLPLLPALLAGEEIEPVISNDQYGWLLTVYQPLRDSSGTTVAYAAADISMEDVVADRYIFVIRMMSLLLGAAVIIVAVSLWFAQRRMVAPLNALAAATDRFAYDSEADRRRNTERLRQLDIKTGDEIENLYNAISKTTGDMAQYISLIAEQSAEVAEKAQVIARMQDNIILSFANMVENRDENTGSHIRRTAAYVRTIGLALRQNPAYAAQLSDEYLEDIRRSAPLHDIGKIKIPDYILNKPGKLTVEEFEIIKTHAGAGREILQEVLTGIEGENYLSQAILMSSAHHEKWDGSGYPQGLAGEDIPLCARIMALADVFDALLSKRSYKQPIPFDEAVEIIRAASGTHFDPAVVEAFLSATEELRRDSQ